MPVTIDASDEISRCIIFARFFDGEVHTDELLWKFEGSGEDGKTHESAVLRRLAPVPSDVHDIGCGIAAKQNEDRNQPDPGPKRRYYCGFRTAAVASLPTGGDGYTIEIMNSPEHGVDAHVDVALTVLVTGRSARAARRTDAGLAMAEQFGPPEAYQCECDIGDGEHPLIKFGPECLVSGLKDRWPHVFLGELPLTMSDELTAEGSQSP